MKEQYDNILNDFELKAYGLSSPGVELKWDLVREYKRAMEVVYELRYEDVPIFPRILTREWTKKEEIRDMLIEAIRVTALYIDRVKDKEYTIDYFDELFQDLQSKLYMDNRSMDFCDFMDRKSIKIRTELSDYIKEYLLQNKKATYKEVAAILKDFGLNRVLPMYEKQYKLKTIY